MTISECIGALEYHNEWRRGEDCEMLDPKYLGETIEESVRHLKHAKKMKKCLEWLISDKFDSRDMNARVTEALK